MSSSAIFLYAKDRRRSNPDPQEPLPSWGNRHAKYQELSTEVGRTPGASSRAKKTKPPKTDANARRQQEETRSRFFFFVVRKSEFYFVCQENPTPPPLCSFSPFPFVKTEKTTNRSYVQLRPKRYCISIHVYCTPRPPRPWPATFETLPTPEE